MSSAEIGESIDQITANDFKDAWNQWSVLATAWILEQINFLSLIESDVREEILDTEAQLLPDLNQVWLADFCVDLSIDVIQVIVVGNCAWPK
jgi:hypothetical protein